MCVITVTSATKARNIQKNLRPKGGMLQPQQDFSFLLRDYLVNLFFTLRLFSFIQFNLSVKIIPITIELNLHT